MPGRAAFPPSAPPPAATLDSGWSIPGSAFFQENIYGQGSTAQQPRKEETEAGEKARRPSIVLFLSTAQTGRSRAWEKDITGKLRGNHQAWPPSAVK